MKPNSIKTLTFLITLWAGIFVLYPLSDYQQLLSQGDHGRDLYAFQQTISGAQVYKDYWWVYGPLMPVYYSWFDRLLGVSIHSVLIGKLILQLCSGLFIFLSLRLFLPSLCASCGAIWFWVFNEDFFFTYNHAGGIAMVTLVVYAILLYLRNPRFAYLLLGLAASFALTLIKLNFGICAWLVLVGSVVLIDVMKKNPVTSAQRYFYFLSFLLPAATYLSYWSLMQGLTINEIRQCLPYMKGDQPYETSIWMSSLNYLLHLRDTIQLSWLNGAFAALLLISLAQSIRTIIFNKNKERLMILLILLGFLLINAHEFLMSGVLYRSYWIRPLQVLLIFFLIGTATQRLSKLIQTLIYATILLLALIPFSSNLQMIEKTHIPQQYLSSPRGKIFVGNHPQWIDTVNRTTEFLSTHLQENETFFALPYDCLYYYLTDKTSPTRQLIFFEHIKIPQEQEQRIIQDLENKHVNWALVSSRMVSPERGLGVLGQTYCPIIGKYLEDNFVVAAGFGDWQNIPGWAWHHGTKILKRKIPYEIPKEN